eukprot:scaffold1574_cov373-Prasinococcus_capsulatus_cf.AAC.2
MSAFACSSSITKVSMKAPTAAARKTVAVRPMFSRPATSLKVTNGARVNMMQVSNPYNKYYETLSYLPPLSDFEIARQIEYITSHGWSPCIEFDSVGVRERPAARCTPSLKHWTGGAITRENNASPGYYDGRYWAMWKLPMFGCSNPNQVLEEIQACKQSYPDAFIRIIGFDADRQVQVVSFIVAKPRGY